MKSFFAIIFTVIIGAGYLNAQEKSNVPYYVYGVDFSNVKVHAATESVEQFAEAFEGINMLLISEPKKYDFSLMLEKRVEVVIEPMLKKLANCKYDDLITYNSVIGSINEEQIIKQYELPQSEGIGVVFIAKMLNKALGEAIYDVVVFDVSTREIVDRQEVVGKAKGFGLRNYWAGSLYNIIKKVKLHK